MYRRIFIVWLCLFAFVLGKDKGHITGTVVDRSSSYPLPGVNLDLVGTTMGAASDVDGYFEIRNIPKGAYKLRASFIGYQSVTITDIHISTDSTINIDIDLSESTIEGEGMVISALKPKVERNATQSVSLANPAAGGYTAQFRNRSTGLVAPGTESYDKIVRNNFQTAIETPVSTFAADVDGASYANARRFLNNNQLPPVDAIRPEEFINYFSYDYEEPLGNDPLSINLEYGPCPWNDQNKLVHIGLRGKAIQGDKQISNNLVFLIDVSGSMEDPDKLPLLKKSFKLMVDQLNKKDRVAIVTYAGAAGCVLPPTKGHKKEEINEALDRLDAGGSTAGGAGIELAYKIAKENFKKEGNNRVILATDGDFNVGISSAENLRKLIEAKKDDGIFLTVLGFGTGNYRDHEMQELANRGNGNHFYIDNLLEAKKVMLTELGATLYTIAKDVKIQVEFNPAKVKSYRLIGYENRLLKEEDFDDDEKDAGEIGAGHTVTALYEIVPIERSAEISGKQRKYSQVRIKPVALTTQDILTVKFRYKDPDGSKSKLLSKELYDRDISLAQTSNDFRFSAAVAQFAMLLGKSEFVESATYASTYSLGKSAMGEDPFGYRAAFVRLVEQAELLVVSE